MAGKASEAVDVRAVRAVADGEDAAAAADIAAEEWSEIPAGFDHEVARPIEIERGGLVLFGERRQPTGEDIAAATMLVMSSSALFLAGEEDVDDIAPRHTRA